MRRKLFQFISVALVGSIIMFTSCEKQEDSSPKLPPLTSFAIDVDYFDLQGDQKSAGDKSNFFVAAVAVHYWNTVLTGALFIPVAAYVKALDQKAERIDNNTWQWAYSVNAEYSARLTANVVSDSVLLSMSIAKGDEYEEVWYTGKFNILRTGGEWTIYDIPLSSETAWLKITWNADYKDKTFDTRYTVVKLGDVNEGSYIEYGKTSDTDYNAFYNLYSAETEKSFEILYNTKTHIGSVAFENTRLCWDENLVNTPCP